MIMQGRDITVCYDGKEVLNNVSLDIRQGEIVSIIGPNGSGKSTILKVLSRTLKPQKGTVYLDSRNIYELKTRLVAQRLAVLPQVRHVPGDFTVETLVAYGRYPHMGFGHKLKQKDIEIVDWAIGKTGLDRFRSRFVETLSGGERQRAWIAMALAQQADILLLDEPTTFLDIAYQLEVLELLRELNEKLGLTIVMVLHDLNQAVRYSEKLYAIKAGRVYGCGTGSELLTKDFLRQVYAIDGEIYMDWKTECPYFIPEKLV